MVRLSSEELCRCIWSAKETNQTPAKLLLEPDGFVVRNLCRDSSLVMRVALLFCAVSQTEFSY